MASREKKPSTGKKQPAESSAMPQKEISQGTTTNPNDAAGKLIKKRNINPARKVNKRVGKKVIALSLKAKDKKQQLSKKIVKVLLNTVELKKNGVKPLKPKRIIRKKSETTSTPTELIPVVVKRKKKISTTPKPIKTDTTSLSKIDETINSILHQIMLDDQAPPALVKVKKPRMRKPKIETASPKTSENQPAVRDTISETIEDVMKDLCSLIKEDEITQNEDITKLEVKKVAVIKTPKETIYKLPLTIEDDIKIDASAKHLIDMLDLSVSKSQALTTSPEICIRRHSIEKLSDSHNTALFTNVRTHIVKANRNSKLRSSIDGLKRFSPYYTRSDSPAQKLRNGKPRKMKDNLLGGIECRKRRKRVGSEYSGSERSKLSGYESDSSFSDLSSNLDSKKEPLVNGIEDNLKSEGITDDNSNLRSDLSDAAEFADPSIMNSSLKVPEKSILLDIMKQAFSDVNMDQLKNDLDDKAVVPTQLFYGNTLKSDESKLCEPKVAEAVEEKTETQDDLTVQSPKPSAQFMIDEAVLQSKVDEIIKSMEDDDFPDTLRHDLAVETIQESKCEQIVEINHELDDVLINDEALENISEEMPTDLEPLDNLTTKESILEALGLQSLKAVEEAKLKEKLVKSDYTGSLKTVIKINRIDKNKRRNILKFPAYKYEVDMPDQAIKLKEGSSSNTWKPQNQSAQSSDTAGAPRKSHNSNRINMDGSSEHNSDGDTVLTENDEANKILVIPEKASSFSVHPGRLCKDECSYCFGKFGLFDTPCHIAQMKSVDRQDKILEAERHITRDSCLCDACYRHVDRKSNTPSYLNKGSKRNSIIAPGPRQNHCHVLSCTSVATHILRRKWIIKMRKSINIDLDNPGLHSIPICDQHYLAVEHLMICAMCKRRLTRNQIHYLGPETNDLNTALNAAGIPAKLFDKPVVCKLCRYFASLILRPIEDRPENTHTFFRDYRKRLLHFHNIEVMEDIEEDEPPMPQKEKFDKDVPSKKRKKLHHKSITNNIGPPVLEPQVDLDKLEPTRSVPSDSNSTGQSRSESPSDYMVDYNTLIPSIAMECGSDPETSKKAHTQINNTSLHLGSNSSISVRELFPGEEDLGLQCHIDFSNSKEKTPEGWERCTTIVQYDTDTKILWQELQKPYGNQSSFLRHLVLLEKYFRSGDLVLSQNASHHSINYSESVQNRLRAYDNIPKSSCSQINRSCSGIITTKDASIINAANIPKNTPITITQINNITPTIVNKTRVPPPGLISLHPGTSRPKTPALIKAAPPQTNKIKIPITKNWRPTLIPIDPSKKSDKDKKPGYVKVVSNGKPYFITVDDYNRMCAIKKSYDLKQKRLLEAAQQLAIPNPIKLNKGLIISKTSPVKVDSEIENNIDRIIENHEIKSSKSPIMILPKIPKSLTVIPQTVQQKSSPPLNTNSAVSK